MAIIGYARVSTHDQDCALQEATLKAAGCNVVRCEKRSGTTTDGRVELATILDFLQPGDTLLVTRLDRLGRSLEDLLGICGRIQEQGAALRATEQNIDTSSAAGRAFMQMLGVFAEFEVALKKERQAEGIAKAKAAGVYSQRPGSRKPRIDVDELRRRASTGEGPSDIAKAMGIARASVYRVAEEHGIALPEGARGRPRRTHG